MQRIGIIGLGLIGGSLAEALYQRTPALTLIGVDNDEATLNEARAAGIFSQVTNKVADISPCDLIVVCVPLPTVETIFTIIAESCNTSALVTDVIGLKEPVLNLAREHLKAHRFVGSHPMAGGTVAGFSERRAELFEGFPVAICPHDDATVTESIAAFWRSIGAEPLMLSPSEHDRIVAMTSHLPYLTSVILRSVASQDATTSDLRGKGFTRATRYADFLPEIMGSVVGHNPHIPGLLREFSERYAKLADELEKDPNVLLELARSIEEG